MLQLRTLGKGVLKDRLLQSARLGDILSGWRILFRKGLKANTTGIYTDNNCDDGMYCNDKFVELESLVSLGKRTLAEK